MVLVNINETLEVGDFVSPPIRHEDGRLSLRFGGGGNRKTIAIDREFPPPLTALGDGRFISVRECHAYFHNRNFVVLGRNTNPANYDLLIALTGVVPYSFSGLFSAVEGNTRRIFLDHTDTYPTEGLFRIHAMLYLRPADVGYFHTVIANNIGTPCGRSAHKILLLNDKGKLVVKS